MKKELITKESLQPLSKKIFDKLTIPNVMMKITKIMENHIGYKDRIPKSEIFYQLFGKYPQDSLEDWVRWEYVKKAMHRLRQQTFCFISSKHNKETKEWDYFIIKTEVDAMAYVSTLEKMKIRMTTMQKRALQSAKERWYLKTWTLPRATERKLLG